MKHVPRFPRSIVISGLALLSTFAVVAAVTWFVDYDLSHQSRLINVSCRGPAGTAPESLLMGFVVAERPQTIVVRARHVSPPRAGSADAESNLLLRVVRNDDGVDVGRNERWQVPGNERLTGDLRAYAPAGARDPACVLTLAPGGYSALVEDRSGTRPMVSLEMFVIR